MLDYHELATELDPLSILLMREDEDGLDPEVEVLESERRAELHRTAPKSSDIDYAVLRSRY